MNQAEIKRRQAEAFANILMLVSILVLGRGIGDSGIAYVALAVEMYALFWSALSGNLSETLGRLLRNRKNKRQYINVVNIRRNVMSFQLILGLAGFLILLASAGRIGELFHIPYSVFIIRILSPAVLLRSATSVLLGYFQGEGSEFPRAVAGVLRQVFVLGFGILFSNVLGNYGEKVSKLMREENFSAMWGGMGIAIAVSLSEVFILVFLSVLYMGIRRSERNMRQETLYTKESLVDCIRNIYVNRWPIILTEVLKVMPLVSGLFLFSRMTEDEAAVTLEYSAYVGGYLVACGVAVSLISIVVQPMIPKIFGSLRREENRFAKTVFQSGVHICLVHGIFLAIFAAVMGSHLAAFLCPENTEAAAKTLQGGSSVVLFTALSFYFGRVLHGAGKKFLVLGAVAAANVIYIVSALIFLGTGKAGVLSLVYGGIVGLFLLCILLGILSYRQMRARADWLNILIVPMGAGGVAGLICLLLGNVIAPHLGSLTVLLITFVTAAAVYWVLLLFLRNFKENELEIVAGGRLISALGQMLRVY